MLLVVVLAAITCTSQVPTRSGRTNSSSVFPKTHTYSVKLTATGSYTDSVHKENFKLTGIWQRLVVKLADSEGMLVDTPEKAAGTLEGLWQYQSSALPDKCKGEAPYSGKALATLVGWNSTRDASMSHVQFDGEAEDGAIKQPEVPCPNTTFPNLWSRGNLMKLNTDGLEVSVLGQTGGSFRRRGGSMFFPLDHIRDGKGFTVKGSGTDGDGNYSYVWSVEIVFTPGTTSPPPDPPSQQDCSIILKKRCEDLRKATWDFDRLIKELNRLRTTEVIARVNEIQKLIDETTQTCGLSPEIEELAEIKKALEEWKGRHRDTAPRLIQSQNEGRAIWNRLYAMADKICKKCCGGIGPAPTHMAESNSPRRQNASLKLTSPATAT